MGKLPIFRLSEQSQYIRHIELPSDNNSITTLSGISIRGPPTSGEPQDELYHLGKTCFFAPKKIHNVYVKFRIILQTTDIQIFRTKSI